MMLKVLRPAFVTNEMLDFMDKQYDRFLEAIKSDESSKEIWDELREEKLSDKFPELTSEQLIEINMYWVFGHTRSLNDNT